MSTHAENRYAPRESTGAQRGLTLFAGAMMIAAGVYHAFIGIAALFNDTIYVTTPGYIYQFDLTGWGWAHLLLGVLVAVAGGAVLQGQTWGRMTGIALAVISMIANFLFLPYYPLWSILIIVLDVAVIWALATYARDA